MRIGRQIRQDMVRSAKRPLSVDDPVLPKQCPQEGVERLLVFERLEVAVETKLALLKSLFQASDELSAKDFAYDTHR